MPIPVISVIGLAMTYGSFTVMRDLNFEVHSGEIFVIMGGSGCGKSTLMRHLIGLQQPTRGQILHHGTDLTRASPAERRRLLLQSGVMYQSGALWSSLTLAENVALPLEEHTTLNPRQIQQLVSYKLALTGLSGYDHYYPAQLSGGMNKRAGIARAIALDPPLLFLDEPGAGLDPPSSHRLNDLILRLRDSLGSTIIIVTHELESIFRVADRALFLDPATRTQGALGPPATLATDPANPAVRAFLRRNPTPLPTP